MFFFLLFFNIKDWLFIQYLINFYNQHLLHLNNWFLWLIIYVAPLTIIIVYNLQKEVFIKTHEYLILRKVYINIWKQFTTWFLLTAPFYFGWLEYNIQYIVFKTIFSLINMTFIMSLSFILELYLRKDDEDKKQILLSSKKGQTIYLGYEDTNSNETILANEAKKKLLEKQQEMKDMDLFPFLILTLLFIICWLIDFFFCK